MFFKRIGYFLFINILVLTTISITFNVLARVLGLDLSAYWTSILTFSITFGFGGAFASLLMSKWSAKTFMRVQVINPSRAAGRERWLLEKVHEISRKAKLPKMPEVGIYPSPEVNAFATGPSKSNSLVAVSDGILQAMNEDELEGVLAHEVAHIANGDMVTMTLLQGVINSLVLILANVLSRIIGNAVDERSRFWVELSSYFALQILLSILAMPVLAYFSRWREYRADEGSAKLAGSYKMIQALRALATCTGRIDNSHQSFNSFKISSKPSKWAALFSTHPPIPARIARLERLRF